MATSSLELGIDMGAVDLVIQVESPKSVARGLQRIGRAGHGVGDGQPRADLPQVPRPTCSSARSSLRRMREGLIEPTVVPRNALDVLAQQIVAIAAPAAETGSRSTICTRWSRAPTPTRSSRASCSRTCSTCSTAATRRTSSPSCGARIVWDRLGRRRSAPARARASWRSTNAGTIPDRGLYSVTLPDGRRVGELDEEMVYEARPGQTFLLGASTWRIEEIGRDRVIVTPGPGRARARCPFWKGDSVGRPKELGEAIGAFSRWAVDQEPGDAASATTTSTSAPRATCSTFLREQQAATRVLPSDRTIVVERFRDEIGDWRLCVLSPFGGRVHAAWGLALSARIRERYGARVRRDLVRRRDHRAPARRRRGRRRGLAPSWS